MSRSLHRVLIVLVALLSGACASSKELARRSAVALQGGDPMKAFAWAKRSLDKDPANTQARAAMYEAVQLVASDWKSRIFNLADADTVAAAREALEFAGFRAEASSYRAPVDPDSSWSATERQIRIAAGRIRFEDGESNLANDRPKRAYGDFVEASRLDPRRRDVEDRIAASLESAVTRVAVLPLDNETGRGGLSSDLTALWQERLAGAVHAPEFRFTRLVSALDVRNAMDRSRHLERLEAIAVGRRLGAQQVVWGRVYGLESDTHTETFHDVIYRKTTVRDPDGNTITRFEAVPFEAITREREIDVSVELELIAIADGRTLFSEDRDRHHRARTAYTSFQPQGSCDDYCLVPNVAAPSVDLERAKKAEASWKQQMPSDVKLPSFLDHARKERGRREYEPRYRDWFVPSGPAWVFLDDLPPAGDLAYSALVGEWRSVLDALERLDPVDEVDAGRVE